MKNTLTSNGRRLHIYNKSPRLNLESKTKPGHLFDLRPYSTPIRPLRCSSTRRHPRLANPSVSEVTPGALIHQCPLNTNHPHRKTLRSTPSPFHYDVSQSGRQPQGESSGRKILEKSVPLSNNFLSVQLGCTAEQC
jgi:hypothetical protein